MQDLKNRREPRVQVALDVVLQLPSGIHRYQTKDISYRGVFITCQHPLKLGRLVRFQISDVDDEPLQLLGLVAHRLNPVNAQERGMLPGMGIQLYSMGTEIKERWRALVQQEYDRDPYARRIMQLRSLPQLPVRVEKLEQLVSFAQNDLFSGGTFLRSQNLFPQGTRVALKLIHPHTDRGFLLEASVTETISEPNSSRGLKLQFPPVDEELHTNLERFLRGE